MIDGGTYHVEIAERLATLYVVGDMTASKSRLIDAFEALPSGVEVLCINLDGAEQLGDMGLVVLDELRSHWKSKRRGAFRVAFALSPQGRRAYKIEVGVG